jgi:hypothetical protein
MRFQQHDFAGSMRRPVREFFRTVIWEPLAESIGEVRRKQYYPLGYTPALDGLRGLMTVGIILYHALACRLIHGTVLFMDVFFVMSGYFITSLLMRDIQRERSGYGSRPIRVLQSRQGRLVAAPEEIGALIEVRTGSILAEISDIVAACGCVMPSLARAGSPSARVCFQSLSATGSGSMLSCRHHAVSSPEP